MRSRNLPHLRLHREVEWYFGNHRLKIHALEAVLSALEECPVTLPPGVRSLRGYCSAGFSYDAEGYPVLLLVQAIEK